MRYLILLIISAVMAFAVSPAHSGDKPFELFPPTNGAAPAIYTKPAPVFDPSGKRWDVFVGATMEVSIDAGNVLQPVTPYQFGMNTCIWSGGKWLLDPDRIEKARQAGLRFWRFPGGSVSDTYHWDGNYRNRAKDNENRNPAFMAGPGFAYTDDFIEFCRKTHSEAILTVNYGCARYEDVQVAANLAAGWVRYFNVEKGFKVRYWEIGNENYGPWEDGTTPEGKARLTGDVYGGDFKIIAAAMKKVDPDIFVGAPVVDYDDGSDWNGYRWWDKELLPAVSGKVDFLVHHHYFGIWPYDGAQNYQKPDNEQFFNDIHSAADAKDRIDAMVKKYADSPPLPIAFTEFDMVQSPSQSIQLINALFMGEVIGEQIKAGFASSMRWDWQNGLETKTGGDDGLLSNRDPRVPDATPRPAYYTYALYSRAFGDHMISAGSSDPKLKVYASRFADGELGIILVNENPMNATINFHITNFSPKGNWMGWVLTGRDLNDFRVGWNGVYGPEGGGGPFPIDVIPPYSGKFDPGKPFGMNLPRYSLTGIVLY